MFIDGEEEKTSIRWIDVPTNAATTNMARTHGQGRRGERLRMSMPHGHSRTTTFNSPLTLRGMIAPFVLSSPINRDAFKAYVEQVLVPALRPDDIVIMDTVSGDKSPHARALIEAAEANLVFLPRADQVRGRLYSPDFDPIDFAHLRPGFERMGGGLRQGQSPAAQGC